MNQIKDFIASAWQILQNMTDPMYIISPDNQILWMNDTFENQFGSDVHHWSSALDQLIFSTKEDLVHTIVHLKDGSSTEVQRQLVPILNDGEAVIAYTGILKESQKSKDDQYAMFKIVADNTFDVIVLVDNGEMLRYVSPSIERLLGYASEQYVGKNAFGHIHPEDIDFVRKSHYQAVQTKTPIHLEYRMVHEKGSTVYVETSVKPVLDSLGNFKYIVGVVRDITTRKQTEQLLENILESVNAAVWSTDKDFNYYNYCSKSIEKISGIPRNEIINKPIRLHDHIHPEDNAMMIGEMKPLLDRGIPANKIIRYIHIEDQTKWVNLLVRPYKNHEGKVERLDGMLLDITEKKQAELALEESEQRYKSLFEYNLDGVFSIDLYGDFVDANQTFEKITGIQMESLNDRCFIGLIYDEDHIPVYQVLSEVMQQKEPRDVECRITRAVNGVQRIVSITFVPILLSGELNGVHGIVKDITERKQEEQELILSEERYKTLQQSINRFSNDLVNVMKVAELENRLIDEVKNVLPISYVSIEEIMRDKESLLENSHETWMKIAEKELLVYLRITFQQPLLKVEQEWLETAVHYVSLLYDNLQLIEDLMQRVEIMVSDNQTPKWMLRLLFRLSEKERASLSSDLHDSVLQDLIIWYRKLESLRSSSSFSNETKEELIQIEEGLLDAIHQIRITCNELRPPFLLKMGLVESLKSLFSYARMFSNYEIEFNSGDLQHPLNEDQILGLYRIVQELLNNANKHSKAEKVTMSLSCPKDHFYFSYMDDGVGVDLSDLKEGTFKHMGIAGIENRVLSLDGKMELYSAPQEGLQVDIYIPYSKKQKGDNYGNIVG
ncbi:PAS domain S-box protein [Ectobacillus polymachus]|uniref:sensor histidine kinase n=1 Tax=Ectobacillus polymachus TaxID=1508806 RepID=UPI003A8A1195